MESEYSARVYHRPDIFQFVLAVACIAFCFCTVEASVGLLAVQVFFGHFHFDPIESKPVLYHEGISINFCGS